MKDKKLFIGIFVFVVISLLYSLLLLFDVRVNYICKDFRNYYKVM